MKALLHHRSLTLATIAFLAATAVAGGLAFAGSDLLNDRPVAVPIVLVLLVSGVFALLGWATERTRREELGEEVEAERQKLADDLARTQAEFRATQDELVSQLEMARAQAEAESAQRAEVERETSARLEGNERALRELRDKFESELEGERRVRERVEQSRREEKEWALHLRKEVVRLQQEYGTLGDTGDVRALVLQVAKRLVGAEKGLLLSRADENADRLLDLVCHEGFENEPADSAVAQRFAHQVIERDATIRENDEADLAHERRTPADWEIESLLAIPIYIADDFEGVVVLANRPGGFKDYDDEVLLALGDHAGAVLHNERLRHDLRTSYVGTVRVLADAIEAKDRFLRGHAEQVAAYVAAVAARLGLERREREELVYSTLLHDVGKIGISERILMKPAALTPEERTVIQLHPRIGYRLVHQVPALRNTELAILHHHERWDGEGYPAGLHGAEIPLEARIIAVADAFGAMTADRPYRRRLSFEDAVSELERGSGTQFDPMVVRLFVEEVRRQPPGEGDADALHEALADPEIDARRSAGDPVLGAAAFSITDNLTFLYTHRHLHESAETEARRASVRERPFSVVMVEVADVERINREEGYAAGDEAIQHVARAVEAAAVRCGGTACRDAGRRLALVVPGDEAAADECSSELSSVLDDGPSVRIASATWRPRESGDDVIARARAGLREPAAPPPYV
jgi:HD-GYP domain-containing protein (c-di-GMP phosphodiesterase class II)